MNGASPVPERKILVNTSFNVRGEPIVCRQPR
jgi:predicted NodU family carbamoyl transferase